MLYWAYISFIFISFQLFNVLLNFIFRQKIRNTGRHSNELISVLIPARNEEKNIGFLLDNLQKIKNAKLEIIVFDDQSTDNTAKIVKEYSNSGVRVIQSEGLPNDWLGKNYACYQLARNASGEYYLFIDADVRLYGEIIHDAVDYSKRYHLGLLSIFPRQVQHTFGEKSTVPIMNYILLTLLPLVFVRISPFVSHSAANGQFMLFDAKVYDRFQPHKKFKNSPVEDIDSSRFLKKQKINITCITGEDRVQCRMYEKYAEALNGFAKNVFMFFGNRPLLAFLFWLCASLGFIPILFMGQNILLIYLAILVLIQVFLSVISKQNTFYSIVLLPVQLFFLLHVIVKSLLLKKSKEYLWKGRHIYS